MKNLKKLLAVIITVALMATMMVPVFAADEISADAEICANLNLLLGEDDGVTSEYLAKNTERIQTAIVFLRLLGKEAEAVSFDGEETFADADKVAWKAGRNVLAYLKANPELGWVGDAGNFKPRDIATAQEVYKVILEVLGYKAGDGEDFDFTWKETLDFAADKGLTKIADVKKLTNDDLAAAIVEALLAETVDGEVLVEKLIEDGIIDKDDAIAEGLIEDELKVTAAVIDKDKIEVKLNKAVEKAPAITLKRGLVPYTITSTLSEDKKSVTIQSQFALPEGDYTVEVEGIAEALKVKVEAEKAVSLEIKSIGVQKIAASPVKIVMLNQYGKEMNASAVSVTAFNQTRGVPVVVNGHNLKLDDNIHVVNDVIVISAIHSRLIASKNVTIIAANAADSIQFGAIVLPKDQTRLLPSETAYEVKYTLLNQYGEEMKLPAGSPDANGILGGVLFVSTDPTVVKVGDIAVDANGVMKIKALKEGTATLTALVVATSKSATLAVNVEGAAAAKSITIAAPASLVVAGEDVEIPYVALDQYGAQIAAKDMPADLLTHETNKMTFGTSNSAVIDTSDFAFSKGKLTLTPSSNGTATVYVYYKGVLQNSVTFTVEKKAEAVRVSGIKDLPIVFEVDSESGEFTKANVIVIDQYNREMKNFAGTITVEAKGGAADGDKVKYEGGQFKAAATAGSKVFTFAIQGVNTSAYDVTMTVIETKDIASYELSEAGTMYAKDAEPTTEKQLTLTGKTADGKAVQLKAGKVTLTTSTNSGVAVIDKNLKVKALAKGEAVVAVWSGSLKLAEVKVTVSDAERVATSVSFKTDGTYTVAKSGTLDMKGNLVVKDQYGDNYTIDGYWTTSDASKATVDSELKLEGGGDNPNYGKVTAGSSAGEVTIGYIAKNGVSATKVITID